MKSLLLTGMLIAVLSCTPSGVDQTVEEVFVANPDSLFVPDSSRYNNIRVRLVARVGISTAYRLDHISISQSDTLFNFLILGYHKEQSGGGYELKDIILDSTLVLVLNPPRFGRHFFKVYDNQAGFLMDSTMVY